MFNETYYKKIIDEYGYEDISRFKKGLGQISKEDMNIRFFCHKYGDKLARVLNDRKNIIVTTGFGMSGNPHLGTISQIMRVKFLVENQIPSQIVIGDLDALNGKNKSLNYVLELSEKFKKFINKTIGEDNKFLILRDQIQEREVLLNDYLLSNYVNDEDFFKAEEDLHGFYAKEGKVDQTMTFRRKRSLLLMISDFISLFKEYNGVGVMLGIDEHKYVLLAQEILGRIKRSNDDGLKEKLGITDEKILSSIYTKLLKGLNGYPKQSKSFPDSGILVEDSLEIVRNKIFGERNNLFNATNYEDNVLVNMMIDTFYFKNSQELNNFLKFLKAKDNNMINIIINDYIEYLLSIFEEWKKI